MKPRQVPSEKPSGDPYRALGYIVSGVLLYGALGWLADSWLGTSFLVVLGILLGAGLGFWMVFKTFGYRPADDPPETRDHQSGGPSGQQAT